MVLISTYRSFWAYLAGVVPGIQHHFVVHEESDMASVIREIDAGDVILFAVVPSSDMQAISTDDYEEVDSVWVFIVKKTDRGAVTHSEFLSVLETTQLVMIALKNKLIELASDTEHTTAYSHMMHNIILSSIHTDPEYNMLGCDGWSLSFKLKTKGTSNS